jgi:uncharacterized damage-inducible protein DinB
MNTDTASFQTHFLDQFRYTRWANQQVLDALGEGDGTLPERALRLISHLLRAQDVWIGRIQGEADLPDIWGRDTLEECRARADASAEAWLGFLHDCAPDDFTDAVRYENSKGKPFASELREICGHVVNHSTHHRAQIALLLREDGVEHSRSTSSRLAGAPPATDYIFYARAR